MLNLFTEYFDENLTTASEANQFFFYNLTLLFQYFVVET